MSPADIIAMAEWCVTCDDCWNDECERDLRKIVCPQCRGRGTSSAYLGAFTQSQWADEDDDWKDAYMRGEFDQTCPECDGRNVVDELTDEAAARPAVVAWFREMNEMYAIEAAERRMGA
jgi:DnaJ-class molecular chaperone